MISSVNTAPKLKRSILYVMNVDWDWVKQRPHFLAEGLSLANEVLVIYPYSWRRSKLALNSRNGVNILPFYRVPFGGHISCIKKLNAILLKSFLAKIFFQNDFDFIWISSAEMFESLPGSHRPWVIYDCMDDVIEFKANKKSLDKIAAAEKTLIKESKHIFCSSLRLKIKMLERGARDDQCTVVFNALDLDAFISDGVQIKINRQPDFLHVGYIGTISNWFDFEAILKAVDVLPTVIFYLVGPIENVGNLMPSHERIVHIAPVDHKKLKAFSMQLDLLVMPFLLTNLVLSVDPVKLYEYIFFDKPILSVFYPGLEKFEKFVNFYEGHDQFISKISQYIESNVQQRKFSKNDRDIFLRGNSWKNRLSQVSSTLDELELKNYS